MMQNEKPVQAALRDEVLLRAPKGIHWKSVNGEAVLMHLVSGDYFALDPVGTLIWAKLNEKPASISNLRDYLISEYDCEEHQALIDSREFCGQLVAEKLLEICSQ